ncbi:MAG: autotransporter outer membrane beta-barrel domain-containing protein, partial [Thermoguttaceae bacterium]|nr:autotransporter outer membrane beta-barrel domain-containing protein [Thermoguttaceae bacterium]
SFRASYARAAVVERLRRLLFSPSRLLTAGTLACVLACGGFAVAQTPDPYIFTHRPTAEDADYMVQVEEDGNEISTYYKSYGADKINWSVGETVTVEGLYYCAKTNENGCLQLAPTVDAPDDKQKYQLVYVYAGDANSQGYDADKLGFDKLITESAYAEFDDEEKKLFKAYYVEYEIDPATGLRKLYSETDVQAKLAAKESVVGYTEYFNDRTYLSHAAYNANVDDRSITKEGGGTTQINGDVHFVKNLTVNGGTLNISGATLINGEETQKESVVKSQAYGDATTLSLDLGVIAQGATLTNADGYVRFGKRDENQNPVGGAIIQGAYVSQKINPGLSDLAEWSQSSSNFIGETIVGETGRLVVADAGFGSQLTLSGGSESYLYGDTSFHSQSVDVNGVLKHGVDVQKYATLYAGARNLDNATVNVDGDLIFTNVNDKFKFTDEETKEEKEANVVDVVVNKDKNGSVTGVDLVVNENYHPEKYYEPIVTYDENGVATDLTDDNTYEKMIESVRDTEARGDWKDDVNSSSFTGGGTITIAAQMPLVSDNQPYYVQTDFFTILNGDKSGFTGDTNVKLGALVLTSSSYLDTQDYENAQEAYNNDPNNVTHDNFFDALPKVAQQYGTKGKGTFTVHGVTVESGDASEATNGRLVLWRDTLNGKLTQDPDDADDYAKSLETAPILSADKIDFQGFVDKDGNTRHRNESGLGAQLVFNTAFTFENEDLYAAGNSADYVRDETPEYKTAKDGDGVPLHPNLVTDIHSARALATLNANEIAFSESNYIWYDDVSCLKGTADMTLNLNAPTIKIYTDDTANRFGDSAMLVSDMDPSKGNMYVINGNNPEQTDALKALFDKPLVNATVTLNSSSDSTDASAPSGYQVKLNASDVKDFAKNHTSAKYYKGMSEDDQKTAADLDALRHTAQSTDPNALKRHKFFESLYNEDNADKVADTIHNVGLLGFTTPQIFVHYGNPVSPFFAGSAISAASRRGQDENERVVTNDNDKRRAEAESAIEDKEEDAGPTRGVWASYTYTNVEGDSYYDGGIKPGYDLERSGIIGGVRRQYDATRSGGFFFGLTTPEVGSASSIGEGQERMISKMEMTDFQFAGHLEKVIADNWELSLFVGGGMQKMDWERGVEFDGMKYVYKSTGDGNTLTGTAYLAYRCALDDNWTLRPTIGLDSEHSWLYAFEETGDAGELRDDNTQMILLAQPYRFAQTYYNRNLGRVGFTVAYDGDQGWAGLNGRAFYSTQLGGKPCPMISYSAVTSGEVIPFATSERRSTHVMGSDAFSVGGGGYMHLN